MVIEVGSEPRKKLVRTKNLKIGRLICDVDDFLVAKICFKYKGSTTDTYTLG